MIILILFPFSVCYALFCVTSSTILCLTCHMTWPRHTSQPMIFPSAPHAMTAELSGYHPTPVTYIQTQAYIQVGYILVYVQTDTHVNILTATYMGAHMRKYTQVNDTAVNMYYISIGINKQLAMTSSLKVVHLLMPPCDAGLPPPLSHSLFSPAYHTLVAWPFNVRLFFKDKVEVRRSRCPSAAASICPPGE